MTIVAVLLVISCNKNNADRPSLPPWQTDTTDAIVWQKYASGAEDNILPDFSYAGYHHGEEAPAEGVPAGYTVYDVTDYGAIANDGLSDREAFIRCLEAAFNTTREVYNREVDIYGPNAAKAIIYFPEGEYILHDDTTPETGNYVQDGVKISRSIVINAGYFIIRGAGREKTRLVMAAKNYPRSEEMYSSPDMIAIKHNAWIQSYTVPVNVTENVPKGAYSVKASNAMQILPGEWVCLHLLNNNPSTELLRYECGGHNAEPYMTSINGMSGRTDRGVIVEDYHQVKSVNGNVITFYEPIMRDIDLRRDGSFEVMKYYHYEEVGIEDVTFVGDCVEDFTHHRSWIDDGAFKPLGYNRLVNSWIRRVGFESVSECLSIKQSANCLATDIVISGKRGHAGVRAAGSSRVFLGKIREPSRGWNINYGQKLGTTYFEDAGQYHGSGVSKPSMGTVIWRNHWGKDATFESHATQPRATLVDCCKGGWVEHRFGGNEKETPNHLGDLVLWNIETERFFGRAPQKTNFQWWGTQGNSAITWRITPPIVVGFHGEPEITFDKSPDQVKYLESPGLPVHPESLYEAQIQRRLGYIPAWLLELKSISDHL